MKRECGIYQILNTANGQRYVGSSFCVRRRFNDHLRTLRRKEHHNVHLQRAWNKDGEAAFVFTVLAVVERPEQLTTEQRLLDSIAESGEACYNMAISAVAPMRGRKFSAESSERMRVAQSTRVKSPEERLKKSTTMKAYWNNPETRRALFAASEATLNDPANQAKALAKRLESLADPVRREKITGTLRQVRARTDVKARMSAAHMGNRQPDEVRARISATLKGCRRSEETKARMSAAQKARFAAKRAASSTVNA